MLEDENHNQCFFALDQSSRAPLEDEFAVRGILRCPEPVRQIMIVGPPSTELTHEAIPGENSSAYSCRGKYYQSCLVDGQLLLEIRLQSDVSTLLKVEIGARNPAPFREIFSSDFRFPEKVCLIAPGPTAIDSLPLIPVDFARLAVNKAVLIPGAKANFWVMNQLTRNSLTYFTEADKMFAGTRIFRLPTAWLSRKQVAPRDRDRCFWFMALQSPGECITDNSFPPLSRCVRSGVTVAGCALQMLAALGASEILLCGLDMFGNRYWDGSENLETDKVGDWPHRLRMEKMINVLQSQGVSVRHIGDLKTGEIG
jgi:hypothetical protein